MEDLIKKLKDLRFTLSLWEDQKYYDDLAQQEAMMEGRKHDTAITDKINTEINKARAALNSFELWNGDVADELDERDEREEKAKTEQAHESAWNS